MKGLSVAVVLGYFLCASVISHAAAIDCKKAETVAEKLICADNDLLSADYELAHHYRVLQSASTDGQEAKRAQLAWISKRNNCKDYECLSTAYANRMKEISEYLRKLPSLKGESLRTDEYFDEWDFVRDYGDGSKDVFGRYQCCVKVVRSPSVAFIEFSVYFPDSQQVLAAEVPAIEDEKRGLTFEFVDGWGNWGKGSFTAKGKKGTLKIQEVKPTDDSSGTNVLRQYGEYSLSKVKPGTCSKVQQ